MYVQTLPLRRSLLNGAIERATGRVAPTQDTLRGPLTHIEITGRPLHILVAEDNPINRLVVGKMLDRLGVAFEFANNGALALEAVQRTAFDLVLMDCQMPEMDGYEATRSIRALGEITNNFPILALTADVMENERRRCLEVGMDDHLAKPVQLDSLHQMLKTHLGELWELAARHRAINATE